MPAIVLAGGLLFAGIGVVLVVSVNPLIGVIFIAVGLADAVMGLLFLGAFGAGASRGQPAAVEQGEPVTPEMDPSYNPYARED